MQTEKSKKRTRTNNEKYKKVKVVRKILVNISPNILQVRCVYVTNAWHWIIFNGSFTLSLREEY